MAKLDDYTLNLKEKLYKPVMIGGMGVNISTTELALEAAKLGGIGHISDAMSPYVSDATYGTHYQQKKSEKFRIFRDSADKSQVKWDPSVVYEATLRHVRATMERKKGPGAIFINIMEKLTMGDPRETLRARLKGALDGGIDGITLSAGLHKGSLKLIADHPRFHEAFIGIIVSSARALKLFLMVACRLNRLPDYVVVEGPLAGGHLGFSLDWYKCDLKTIMGEVLDFLKKEGLKIPVIPAGGIFTGSDAVGYIKKGASAVQVATRFVISQECGLPDATKQEYIRATEDDVEVNMTSPAGYAMRMLKSSPSLKSNVRPNCEGLGYILDREGRCSYREAYNETPVDDDGNKLPVGVKMCICYHFMRYECYTCGHYVYRLKDTTRKLPNGEYYLPPAAHIFNDYLYSENGDIHLPDLDGKES